MYVRRLIGIIAVGIGAMAMIVAARALVPSLAAALSDRSAAPLAGGVLGAGVMLCVAVLMARLAYRNLFWGHYVASQRRRTERHDPSTESR